MELYVSFDGKSWGKTCNFFTIGYALRSMRGREKKNQMAHGYQGSHRRSTLYTCAIDAQNTRACVHYQAL
jgi:hypothetical protein